MIKTHEEKAISIAREAVIEQTPLAKCSARQGDVVLVRVGDPGRGNYDSTPVGGIQLAAGQHGGASSDLVSVPMGRARHHRTQRRRTTGSHRCAPKPVTEASGSRRVAGNIARFAELGADQVVQEVAD
jgi:hypothetical protein